MKQRRYVRRLILDNLSYRPYGQNGNEMLVQCGTEERIVSAMKRGAQLVVTTWYHAELGTGYSAKLMHGTQSILLDSPDRDDEYFWPDGSDTGHLRCYAQRFIPSALQLVLDRIIKRSDVREEYAGYQSDYAREYRRLYVHDSAPVPRWVSEQWHTPCERYESI